MQRRITRDLLTYLPGQALPALAAFITVPIYTHLFSPAAFGNYALTAAAGELLLLATVTGFGQAAVRFFSAYQLQSQLPSYFAAVLGSMAFTTLATTVVSAGVLLLIQPSVPGDLYPLLWAALVLFVVSAFYATLMDVLRGEEKSRWYTTLSIGQAFGSIILGLMFVLVLQMGIAGLIWGQALSLLLSILPLLLLTTRSVTVHPTDLHRSDFKQLWTYALPFTAGNVAFWTLSLADRYILELFRGSYEVGLYSVANKISWRSIQLLVNLFFLVPAPLVSRLWEERGREATEEALTAFTRMFFLIIIPSVVGISVVAAPLVRLLADDAVRTRLSCRLADRMRFHGAWPGEFGQHRLPCDQSDPPDCTESGAVGRSQPRSELHSRSGAGFLGRCSELGLVVLAAGGPSSVHVCTFSYLAVAARIAGTCADCHGSHDCVGPLRGGSIALRYARRAGDRLVAIGSEWRARLRLRSVDPWRNLATPVFASFLGRSWPGSGRYHSI